MESKTEVAGLPFVSPYRVAVSCYWWHAAGKRTGQDCEWRHWDPPRARSSSFPAPLATVIKLLGILARPLLGGCVKRKVGDPTSPRALSGRCTADCEYPCWGRTLPRLRAEGRCLLDIPGARLGIRVNSLARLPREGSLNSGSLGIPACPSCFLYFTGTVRRLSTKKVTFDEIGSECRSQGNY